MSKPDRVAETMAAVADRLVAAVNANPGDWLKPWTAAALTAPKNPTTGRDYSGMNWWHLLLVGVAQGYESGYWAGFRQWQGVGAQVRKGEKATFAVRFHVRPCCEDSDCEGECGSRRKVSARSLAVFAREQIEIVDSDLFASKIPPIVELPAATFDHEGITKLLGKSDAQVCYGGDRAFYSPSRDAITMPRPEAFESAGAFAATLTHEHIHWSGHKSRLGRDLSGTFGSASYAKEELVAELGAVMYLAAEGAEHQADEQHAAYIANWLNTLEAAERPKAISSAIGTATRAAEYLREVTR